MTGADKLKSRAHQGQRIDAVMAWEALVFVGE